MSWSSGAAVTGRADRWIRRTTIGMCSTAGADQFREHYRHLMILLREYEDFGTHNRRRMRLAETKGQTGRDIGALHHVLKAANACIAVC